MPTAIEFDHVSKQYRLGLVSTKTLSHDIRRFWITNVLHREDPYLKIGEVNDRSTRGASDYVWALRDIDFKVEQGDVVGIIGKNGAGKSTLLKLLSRVTGPTTGTIRAHGRIGSLLEVGTGFHGEMTGRENIFMNGAILGMSRAEIQSKLDEIIDFSGCERYIDTPVKRYSSGMTVRLGFAVAAFLEPEILVVDEVLAVGDAEFQKKAIGKMKDVSQGQGRTVLFVSHNMESIKHLCHTGVLLDKGSVAFHGTASEAVKLYLGKRQSEQKTFTVISKKDRPWEFSLGLEILSARLVSEREMEENEPLEVELEIKRNEKNIDKCTIELIIDTLDEIRVGSYISPVYDVPMDKETFTMRVKLPNHNLARGKYSLGFNIGLKTDQYAFMDYDVPLDVLRFEVKYKNRAKGEELSMWRDDWGAIRWNKGVVEFSK